MFIFIVIVLTLATSVSKPLANKLDNSSKSGIESAPAIRWVFINYHKSGTVFSETLIQIISTLTKCRVKILRAHRNLDFNGTKFIEECADICTIHAPNMNLNWSTVFKQDNKYVWRVVHLLRDPYDMILSGFLYHSQVKLFVM